MALPVDNIKQYVRYTVTSQVVSGKKILETILEVQYVDEQYGVTNNAMDYIL